MDVKNNAPIRELTLTRTFKAPRSLVWQALTDPKSIEQWWGPHGFTTTVQEWDARPHGGIRYFMTAPDGEQYPCDGEYAQAVAPERLVFTQYLRDEHGTPYFEALHTITLTESDGVTSLRVDIVVGLATDLATMPLAGMEQGWNESIDRLGEFLAR